MTHTQDMKELIRQRAHEKFVSRGRRHGHDLCDWLHAEQEVLGKLCTPHVSRDALIHLNSHGNKEHPTPKTHRKVMRKGGRRSR